MFYLKYRPKKVSEIDNTNVRESIEKILSTDKIPHAFLFIGQKGTGKTSSARIFAKAINCTNKKGGFEPCNECPNCKSIDTSASVDVIEMDAASHRGIEEVRNLIKETAFLPMSNKYRVFIIDEAHMITPDAFNVLLKTLEEPPESVVFILATTNVEKVPKTIASRCIIVNFGRAKSVDIIHMLKRIAKLEEIEAGDKLFDLIAQHSEKSFRDAAKIFEELKIQNKLGEIEANAYLGLVGKQNLLEVIEKKSLTDALKWIQEFTEQGGNFKNLLEQLLDELRILLLAKNNAIPKNDIELHDFSMSQITLLLKLFTEAYNNLKISPIDSIPLVIAVADFYNIRELKK